VVLGCSGISWTICKQYVPRSRQITTPTPHHSIFLQAGCSSWRPTNRVKALKAKALKANINVCSTYFLQHTLQDDLHCTWPDYDYLYALINFTWFDPLRFKETGVSLDWHSLQPAVCSVASRRPSYYSNCDRVARAVWKFPPNCIQKLAQFHIPTEFTLGY